MSCHLVRASISAPCAVCESFKRSFIAFASCHNLRPMAGDNCQNSLMRMIGSSSYKHTQTILRQYTGILLGALWSACKRQWAAFIHLQTHTPQPFQRWTSRLKRCVKLVKAGLTLSGKCMKLTCHSMPTSSCAFDREA